MNMSLLSYSKTILSKVKCYPNIYKKEYKKAIKNLDPHEARELKEWLQQQEVEFAEIPA
ncbi:hypothetical protein OO013_06210 [Mangrovivirga sp. M17]|uniref:Uncharacterized protein n=1 Tax=Mangrovivirga halotolerans TaxID=2993936 RepID=A0ABT3RPP3_9BACT|nr:hypothetical protein [Mangrovivirga halotolerans]MCX2743451.1 hypothetical protein [Mangrovivirga halotolerans]